MEHFNCECGYHSTNSFLPVNPYTLLCAIKAGMSPGTLVYIGEQIDTDVKIQIIDYTQLPQFMGLSIRGFLCIILVMAPQKGLVLEYQ